MVIFEKDEEGNVIDTYLDEKEKKWTNKFIALLRSCPKSIELILDNTSIEVFPAGTLSAHIGSDKDGYGINDKSPLRSFKPGPLLPYSEGQ